MGDDALSKNNVPGEDLRNIYIKILFRAALMIRSNEAERPKSISIGSFALTFHFG